MDDPTRRDILAAGAAATAESLGMEDEETAPTEVIESILTGNREGKIEIPD